jgi:four helix bundle protein
MQNVECRNGEVKRKSVAKPVREIRVRAFEFACRIVKLHGFLTREGGTSRSLAGQILRSGTSIAANLEEAHAAQSKADFISKSNIALKEARETAYWLRLLVACNLAPPARLQALSTEANEVVAILTTIVKKARNSDRRGER